MLNNLNKSRGFNASTILSLSLVHWTARPSPGGKLEPRAPSEPGRGGRQAEPPREGGESAAALQGVLAQVGRVARGLPGLRPHRLAQLLPAGQQLLQAGPVAEGVIVAVED